MLPIRLYFVSGRHKGETVYAGHWLAVSSAAAIELAKTSASFDPEWREEIGLPVVPVDEWRAKVSHASIEANAINLS